jgi:nifR3 family TIM-barrel protein
MKDPSLAHRILKAVREAVAIPLTIKIRSGWEPSGKQAIKIARLAQDCGVDAITVHPRTATQAFRGKAEWSVITAVKEALAIPVIGNGDVAAPQDALRMLDETGCDGVMVGRAAIGNPMIFSQILATAHGQPETQKNDGQRIEMMITYLRDSVRYLGEQTACRMIRSRLCWFVKGMRNAGQFRSAIRFIASEEEAIELIRQYAKAISVEPATTI